MTVLFYLGGDSYPHEAGFEARFAERMNAAQDMVVIGQQSMLVGDELAGNGGRSIPERLSRLDALVGLFSEPIILVGRSSGARVAALYAYQHPVAGVVCLAYPFQPQGAEPQPERTAHLAELKTPTLILQGRQDRYGGVEILDKYVLAPVVEVQFMDAGHEFDLSPDAFDEVFLKIQRFIARCANAYTTHNAR